MKSANSSWVSDKLSSSLSGTDSSSIFGQSAPRVYNRITAHLYGKAPQTVQDNVHSVQLIGMYNAVVLSISRADCEFTAHHIASVISGNKSSAKGQKISDIDGTFFPEPIKKYIGDVNVHRVKMLVDADGYYLILNDNLTGVRYAY